MNVHRNMRLVFLSIVLTLMSLVFFKCTYPRWFDCLFYCPPSTNTKQHRKYTLKLIPNAQCTLDPRFLSFSIDAIEMMRMYACFPMNSSKVNTLARGLSPSYLRVGGSPQDFETFVEGGESSVSNVSCEPHFESWRTLKRFNLNSFYFMQTAEFAERNKLDLIFGLNALNRKPNGLWDDTNARAIIDFLDSKNIVYTLGNEPNRFKKYKDGYNKPVNITAKELARDFVTLRGIINHKVYGPDLAHPTLKSLRYLKQFLRHRPKLDAVTYHHYNMHQSQSSLKKFLDPIYLRKFNEEVSWIHAMLKTTETQADLWLGETGSASGGGAKGLSDTFAAGFLYLAKLGLASATCHKVVIRQSFYGGYYGMIDAQTHDPLPDYWSTYLFKKLVGVRMLTYTTFNRDSLHMFIYCQRNTPGNVVVMVINFDIVNPIAVQVKNMKDRKVEKYILTAPELTSKRVFLNGRPIQLTPSNDIPELHAEVDRQPFKLPPASYGFFVVRHAELDECSSNTVEE